MPYSRRVLLRSSIGIAALAVTSLPLQAQAALPNRLNYGLGVCIPAYEGNQGGILFAATSVMRAQVDAAVAAGLGWLRTDLVVQQGCYRSLGSYDWAAWEPTFAYARSRGMKILACLQGQAVIDGKAPSQATTSAARAHVAAFAAAAARHFGPDARYGIDALEVGNEVNTTRFWPVPSVSSYGPLLAAVYPAVKAVRPTLPVIASGTGGYAATGDIRSDHWYQQLYAKGYNAYFDAVTLHPYSGFTTTPGQNEEAYISSVRSLMNSYGESTKAIWGTESGAPTGGAYGVSEADQATIIANSWSYFRAKAGARGPWFVYTLDDFAPTGTSSDAEAFFGLRTSTGREKLAYKAVRSLAMS